MRQGDYREFSSFPLKTRLRTFCALVLLLVGNLSAAFGQTRPDNDNFGSAIALTGTNVSVQGSNVNATKEPGEWEHAGVFGGKSVWWTWTAPANGYAKVSTAGSLDQATRDPLDTVLAIYVGNSVSNLMEIGSNDDGPVDVTSEVSFKASAGTLYRIAVDGYNPSSNNEAPSGLIKLSIDFSLSMPLAPAWGPLASIDGATLSSTNFAGKVVLLNFWATWCGPCVAEIPDLIQLQNDYNSAGFTVVGISIDSSPDGINPPQALVNSFVASQGMNYPVAMSKPRGYGIEIAYGGIPYIPSTFIIDRENHIVQTFVGSQSYDTFERAIVPLLKPPPSLKLAISAGVVRLSWPAGLLVFKVEAADNPGAELWTALNMTPQSDGVGQFIEVPLASGPQFFRLRSP